MQGAEAHCQDAKQGEPCWDEIQWAKSTGFHARPEWYPGLHPTSSEKEIQQVVHLAHPEKCAAPCIPVNRLWCHARTNGRLWTPSEEGNPLAVKVLSYNLYWWNLFGRRNGNGNSAGKLIAGSMSDQVYDFMGFQECENPKRVLGPVGLLKHYTAVQGPHAICAAYHTAKWELLAHGGHDLAEDMKTNFYGRRGAMWLRLRHRHTKRTVFFLNHHGPLSVNSGGICGGLATAHNLMGLMLQHGQKGDGLLLVGDFNANAASLTIQGLWPELTHVHNGDSFGGVDNIFSNVGRSSVLRTYNLGSGGSDHNAISAVVRLGDHAALNAVRGEPSRAVQALVAGVEDQRKHDSWSTFWCGMMENDFSYHVEAILY